ncbi:hypothetical protein AVEN_112862-1 [Araneus ventricosus]|uniref:Uncharacterized protein n=1 Tax=Araneus ventricosus TaxID=182803 RepID=A0A4Y2HUT1_ARAVE|nr:hypothetical protein AVEN_112862-1 [Araneus ventricosus]
MASGTGTWDGVLSYLRVPSTHPVQLLSWHQARGHGTAFCLTFVSHPPIRYSCCHGIRHGTWGGVLSYHPSVCLIATLYSTSFFPFFSMNDFGFTQFSDTMPA